MSETTTAPLDHPEHEWADLLRGLTLPQRKAVLNTLQQSAVSGWPATRAGVESLVAYAQGHISAQEYAARSLVELGYADVQTARELLARASAEKQPVAPPTPREPTGRFDPDAGYDFLFER